SARVHARAPARGCAWPRSGPWCGESSKALFRPSATTAVRESGVRPVRDGEVEREGERAVGDAGRHAAPLGLGHAERHEQPDLAPGTGPRRAGTEQALRLLLRELGLGADRLDREPAVPNASLDTHRTVPRPPDEGFDERLEHELE